MSFDLKTPPDARTVNPGQAVSYHSQGRQALVAGEPVADGEQFNAFAELVKWRRWAVQLLGSDGFQNDADLRTSIAEGADADQLTELRLALGGVPSGGASGDAPAWIIRLHRTACDVAGIGVRESDARQGSRTPRQIWRRDPPPLADVKSGMAHWWNRSPNDTPKVVAFDVRDQWRGEPMPERLETRIGYDFCVAFDPADPYWGGPDAEWAPCLPPTDGEP